MRLLLVEDSMPLQRSVGRGFRSAGYAVDITGDGEEGFWFAESNSYDAIILDLMLPRLDGLSLLRNLRSKRITTHVLILTARDEVEDRVNGLQTGADDYLVKPFAFEELLARVQALCRRSYGHKDTRIEIGPIQIDSAGRSVTCQGAPITLMPREFALLEYLALRRGHVVSRTEIETHLYAESADIMSNSVDSAICILRKKIIAAGGGTLIQTRRGFGYIIEKEAT